MLNKESENKDNSKQSFAENLSHAHLLIINGPLTSKLKNAFMHNKSISIEGFEINNEILTDAIKFFENKYDIVKKIENAFYNNPLNENASINVCMSQQYLGLIKSAKGCDVVRDLISNKRIKKAYIQENNMNFLNYVSINSMPQCMSVGKHDFKKFMMKILCNNISNNTYELFTEFVDNFMGNGYTNNALNEKIMKELIGILRTHIGRRMNNNTPECNDLFKFAISSSAARGLFFQNGLSDLQHLIDIFNSILGIFSVASITKTSDRNINIRANLAKVGDFQGMLSEIENLIYTFHDYSKKTTASSAFTSVFKRHEYLIKELNSCSKVIQVQLKNPESGHVSIRNRRIPKDSSISSEIVDLILSKLSSLNSFLEELSSIEAKILLSKIKNSEYNVIEVSGEEITSLYSVTSYVGYNKSYCSGLRSQDYLPVSSVLHNSCMRHSSSRDRISFYSNNKHFISMIAVVSMNKKILHGRAIVWKDESTGKKYVDRIYYHKEDDKRKIELFAIKNGYTFIHGQQCKLNEYKSEVFFEVNNINESNSFTSFPFLDSARMFEYSGKIYLALGNVSSKDIIKNKIDGFSVVIDKINGVKNNINSFSPLHLPLRSEILKNNGVIGKVKCPVCENVINSESIKVNFGEFGHKLVCKDHIKTLDNNKKIVNFGEIDENGDRFMFAVNVEDNDDKSRPFEKTLCITNPIENLEKRVYIDKSKLKTFTGNLNIASNIFRESADVIDLVASKTVNDITIYKFNLTNTRWHSVQRTTLLESDKFEKRKNGYVMPKKEYITKENIGYISDAIKAEYISANSPQIALSEKHTDELIKFINSRYLSIDKDCEISIKGTCSASPQYMRNVFDSCEENKQSHLLTVALIVNIKIVNIKVGSKLNRDLTMPVPVRYVDIIDREKYKNFVESLIN